MQGSVEWVENQSQIFQRYDSEQSIISGLSQDDRTICITY
jgi:hypothetical protein